MTTFCYNCGHKVGEGDHFCNNCGSRLKNCADSKENFSHLYKDDGGEDALAIKCDCTQGKHEFIAYITHKVSCVATPYAVRFKCQKCGEKYFGRYPNRYGKVVAEKLKEITDSSVSQIDSN